MILDALALLAWLAPRIPVSALALTGLVALAWCAYLDHVGGAL